MTPREGRFLVGTSGYQYDHWAGVFYPAELPRTRWFAYYAGHFDTVEVNNTFYRLPEAHVFDHWREAAPDEFTYALKFSRYGTHLKHLKDPAQTIASFLEPAQRLGPKLGVILVQLRPNWHVDVPRLKAFLDEAEPDYRWALEFRDPTWLCGEVYDVLSRHGAALCVHDLIAEHPRVVTADWVYLRFHGARNGGDYPHQALAAAADRVAEHLGEGRDVYAYFNNDAHGHAVYNALDLRRYVEGRTGAGKG